MKTIFTLLTSLALSISVFASDRPSGSLFVRSNNPGDMKVVLDGRIFETGNNTLMIRDIDKGIHDIKVFRQRSFGAFSGFVRKYELIYDGNLFIKPGRQIFLTIDRFGRTDIDVRKIRGIRDQDWNEDDHDYNYNDRDRDSRYDSDNRFNDYKNSRAISDRDLGYVLQSIRNEWFENNKMQSARQIINTNYFTSDQVKRMMQLFNFESNKLELAKLAYKKTVDSRNYQCVFNELYFSSSKAELSQYIQNCR